MVNVRACAQPNRLKRAAATALHRRCFYSKKSESFFRNTSALYRSLES